MVNDTDFNENENEMVNLIREVIQMTDGNPDDLFITPIGIDRLKKARVQYEIGLKILNLWQNMKVLKSSGNEEKYIKDYWNYEAELERLWEELQSTGYNRELKDLLGA